MGANNTHFDQIPDNEFTRSAILLRGMGIKLVTFNFDDLLEWTDVENSSPHLTIDTYTPESRDRFAQSYISRISDTVSTFILALITKGVAVAVVCPPSKLNGEIFRDERKAQLGYIYEGEPLLRDIFNKHFTVEVAQFIHILETDRFFSAVKQIVRSLSLLPAEVLLIHADPNLVRKARKYHMSAILVEDHKLGFRV